MRKLSRTQLALIAICLVVGVVIFFLPNQNKAVQEQVQQDIELDKQITEAIEMVESGSAPMPGIMKLRELAEQNPDNRRAQFHLGLFSIQSGQFDKAVDRFNNVLALNEKDAEAMYYKAHAFAGIGNYDSASISFDNALANATDEELKEEIRKYINELKNLENAER